MQPTYRIDNLKHIKLFVTDFDGIHTDGSLYVNETGVESVRCSRRDGLGYDMLKKAGIEACIISKEPNPVVTARATKLRIPCHQKVETGEGKLEILQRIAREQGLTSEQVLYMGDDLNDLQALEWAGVPAAPVDCHAHVRTLLMAIGGHISQRRGGDGLIREAVEMVLAAQGKPLAF